MRVTTPLLTRSEIHACEQPVALEAVAFPFRLMVNYNSNKFQICLSVKFKCKFCNLRSIIFRAGMFKRGIKFGALVIFEFGGKRINGKNIPSFKLGARFDSFHGCQIILFSCFKFIKL